MSDQLSQKIDSFASSEIQQYSAKDIANMQEGKLFHFKSPRMPAANMCMIDKVVEISNKGGQFGNGYVIAELSINPDMWFFDCHFKSDPVMPGCLGLDALWQLCGFFLAREGYLGKCRAIGVQKVSFRSQALIDTKKIRYEIQIKKISTKPLIRITGNGVLFIDGVKAYIAENLAVACLKDSTL